jgi:hypothetical protein
MTVLAEVVPVNGAVNAAACRTRCAALAHGQRVAKRRQWAPMALRRHLRLLACLALAAVALRALVPLGTMPDGAALAEGRFALVICTTEGMVTIPFGAVGGEGGHDETPGEGDAPTLCAWAPCSVTALALAEPTSVSLPRSLPAPRLALPPREATAPVGRTGPPLGSRAPPTLLA